MTSDSKIFTSVNWVLDHDPRVVMDRIMIGVKEGIVNITGRVRNFSEKKHIEEVVKSVNGVIGIVSDVSVDLYGQEMCLNPELAKSVVRVLYLNGLLKKGSNVQALMDNSILTLTGNVENSSQKESIEECMRSIYGIKDVLNKITVDQKISSKAVKKKIAGCFIQSARVDAGSINVDVEGGEVVLKGKVKSWREYVDAYEAAYTIPGVTHVENLIRVA